MFIGGSFDIRFLCSNMKMKLTNKDIIWNLRNKDFETQRASYDEKTKVVPQLRKAHTKARE